jgi:hypothetical protein
MRFSFAIVSMATATVELLVAPRGARAAVLTPTGPGTEEVNAQGHREGIRPGWEASAGIGSGFSGTYGLGYEGRLGYTLPVGAYFGAQVQAFYGQGAVDQKAHGTFFGVEGGYKLYPLPPVEIRPYLFLGPAFITEVSTNPTTVSSKTGFAVQPGALATYHLGPAFVGGDFRFLATPGPFGVALMGTVGLGL